MNAYLGGFLATITAGIAVACTAAFVMAAPAQAQTAVNDSVLLDPFSPVPEIQFSPGYEDCGDGCHHHCWHHCWHGGGYLPPYAHYPETPPVTLEDRVNRNDYQADRNDFMTERWKEQSDWYQKNVIDRDCDMRCDGDPDCRADCQHP